MIDVLFKNPYKYFKRVVFEKPFDFRSRASRSEYWYFALGWFICFFLYSVLAFIILRLGVATGHFNPMMALNYFSYVIYAYIAILLIPAITVSIRRFHDTNQSGWLYALLFLLQLSASIFNANTQFDIRQELAVTLVMIVINIIILYFLIVPPTKGDNRYGPQPED